MSKLTATCSDEDNNGYFTVTNHLHSLRMDTRGFLAYLAATEQINLLIAYRFPELPFKDAYNNELGKLTMEEFNNSDLRLVTAEDF